MRRHFTIGTLLASTAFMIAAIALPASSDTLVLNNGTTFSGTLAGADGNTITFRNRSGATQRYAVRDVEAVQFGDAPYRSSQNPQDYGRPGSNNQDNRNNQGYADRGNAGNSSGQGYGNGRNGSNNGAVQQTGQGRPGGGGLVCLDAGGGSTDRNTHYTWALTHAGQAKSNLITKMDTLFRCPAMQFNQLADTFANISVIIPNYVTDARCFGGDAGPLNTNRTYHKDWADRQGRADAVLKNLESKTGQAFACVDSSKQVDLFADVSLALAQAANQ